MTSFDVISVPWDDPRAVDLRGQMSVELGHRYAAPGSDALDDAVVEALAVDPADVLATVLIIDHDGSPLAHGSLRLLRGEWEIKRVVVAEGQRGRGLGRSIMAELERIATDGGATRLILHTGDRQPDAVALYRQLGYTPIPIYEPYVESMPTSLCFEKRLDVVAAGAAEA